MKINNCIEVSDGQSPLEEYFKSFSTKDGIVYVPNFGNAGDALIALGTICFFKRLGLEWKLRKDWWNLRNQTVVFAGGGALVGHYPRCEHVFAGLVKNENKVIVLPHTITHLNKDLLKWGQNLTIFCREKTTFDYISSFSEIDHVGLDHDMAFNLDVEKEGIFNRSFPRYLVDALFDGSAKDRLRVMKRLPRAVSARQQIKNLKKLKSAEVLNCFRKDVESSGCPIPTGNQDISHEFGMGTETLGSIALSGFSLLEALHGFSLVRTDRLHCCIGATLLGIPVEFHGNSYHKNQSVYDYSMRDRVGGVTWCG